MNQVSDMNEISRSSANLMDEQIDIKITALYKSYFALVRQYIVNNSGTSDDAKDIFQEVALLYFKMCQKTRVKSDRQ
ncbi:MAG: hypothetical protein IPL25_06730 [Saprospiraceae bacterium]|nr:hypothetical protein [Candidatus Vicinibacter affinis]